MAGRGSGRRVGLVARIFDTEQGRGGLSLQRRAGYRDYAPGCYAAYLLDPDGNNIEAVPGGECGCTAPQLGAGELLVEANSVAGNIAHAHA